MTLPTPYTVGVRKSVTGNKDAHGNAVESWTAPVNYPVYSIAPATSNEPFQTGRDLTETSLTVLAPVGTPVGSKDLVVVDGEEYTVEGDIADWSKGPFSWSPGISFSLKRVEG